MFRTGGSSRIPARYLKGVSFSQSYLFFSRERARERERAFLLLSVGGLLVGKGLITSVHLLLSNPFYWSTGTMGVVTYTTSPSTTAGRGTRPTSCPRRRSGSKLCVTKSGIWLCTPTCWRRKPDKVSQPWRGRLCCQRSPAPPSASNRCRFPWFPSGFGRHASSSTKSGCLS